MILCALRNPLHFSIIYFVQLQIYSQSFGLPLAEFESSALTNVDSDENYIEGISFDELDEHLRFHDVPLRNLTEEEETLANEARKQIATVMEKNLLRLFAVITKRGQRLGRQEDEPEEVEEAVTAANPNVLPQVAQILGAIFSNNLNLTRIVDQTFGLVPNVVRMQLMGIVKLLTGQDVGEVSTTTETIREEATTEISVTSSAALRSNESSVVEETVPLATTKTPLIAEKRTTTMKSRYRIKSRTTTSIGTTELSSGSATPDAVLEDDELERYEKDLRATAKIYEPFVKDKQPKFFVGPFRDILTNVNFNSTEIIRAVPNIFKGARRAFVLLESLGIVPDVADDLADDE